MEPIEARLDMLKLRFYRKLKSDPEGSLTRTILERRIGHLFEMRQGFAHEVFDLFCKYDMIHMWRNSDVGTKFSFNSYASRRVTEHWHKIDLQNAKRHDFLLRKFISSLKPECCDSGKYKTIFSLLEPGTDPRVYRAFLKVGLDTRKYVKYCPTCKKVLKLSNLASRTHQFSECGELLSGQHQLMRDLGVDHLGDLKSLFSTAMTDLKTFHALGRFCMLLDV